jgi:hypothetical protein
MAERYQNFLSKYQELTNQRDNMLVTRIGQQEDTRYPQWEEYQRTTRSMGSETITGKVDVVGEFNIKVDAPSNLTEQQVFTIFNNPEVKANIYKIVETQTTAAIKKLKNTN